CRCCGASTKRSAIRRGGRTGCHTRATHRACRHRSRARASHAARRCPVARGAARCAMGGETGAADGSADPAANTALPAPTRRQAPGPRVKPLHTTCGADLAVLADIHAASFAEPWSASALAELVASPGAFGFGGDDGFTLARVVADEAEILT